MNIAVLGGGVEGNAIKEYFVKRGDHVQIFDKFQDEDIPSFKLEDYDQIFRSPSVHPQYKIPAESRGNSTDWTSMTNYFFENCKAPIIGVTGTKGKGTTCSFIKYILESIIRNSDWKTRTVHLVGNIGNPAISELDQIESDDIVVFEMSSFQLWDLKTSPHISVVLRIEPDHLDRHGDFDDYVAAKTNIVLNQNSEDYCVYYSKNPVSTIIGNQSKGTQIKYPYTGNSEVEEKLNELLQSIQIPGAHNHENATAAIMAVATFFHSNIEDFIRDENIFNAIKRGIENFKGLPHRIEFVTEHNGVKYYDDNYSSAFPATDVAIAAFENHPTILIAGGKDRHLDLTESKHRFFTAPNIKKIILIGETKETLAEGQDPEKYCLADSLEDAVLTAQQIAEKIAADLESNYDLCIPSTEAAKSGNTNPCPIVLMSPGAASFDMFKNFSDRGDQYQEIVKNLK